MSSRVGLNDVFVPPLVVRLLRDPELPTGFNHHNTLARLNLPRAQLPTAGHSP